jgi:hypothetical protein
MTIRKAYRVTYKTEREPWMHVWERGLTREQATAVALALAKVPGVIQASVVDTRAFNKTIRENA